MDCKLIVFVLSALVLVSAAPAEDSRSKRDVMDSMMNAWNEVVKTLSNAGDAVVQVFKPTEKSVMTKIVEAVQPTEKSIITKLSDGISGN